MADQKPIQSLSNCQRFIGWLRFFVFLIPLIMVPHAGAQVYEHWEPAGANPLFYALGSFANHLWPRLLIGAIIGAIFLCIAMLFKQKPPWHNVD